MKINKIGLIIVFACLGILSFLIWHYSQKPPLNADWPETYSILPASEVNGNLLTIKNVRNFRYNPDESVAKVAYYDRTYNLDDLVKVWYIYEPFGYAAHSFLSFEFKNDIFVTISIEAKTTKEQKYDAWVGLLRSYPLIYVVADENDAVLMRANIRKNQVILYPTTVSAEAGKKLLLELLKETNELYFQPKWYNTVTANCTTLIGDHINNVWPNTIKPYEYWELIIAGYADDLAYNKKWIDTNLSLKEAKQYFNISEKSKSLGDVPNYSRLIREGIDGR